MQGDVTEETLEDEGWLLQPRVICCDCLIKNIDEEEKS